MEILPHYTNLEAAINILSSKDEYITFRATRFDKMNDPTDCRFATEVIKPVITNYIRNHPEFDLSQIEDIDEYPYVLSFCKKQDFALMWRLYNAKVCLEIDKDMLENDPNKYFMGECVYSSCIESDINSAFDKLKENKYFEENIHGNAKKLIALIKHEDFKVENEFRLFALDYNLCQVDATNGNCCFKESKTSLLPTKYRIKGNTVIPYKEIKIKKSALKKIVVREYDQNAYADIEEYLKSVLRQYNYSDEIIIRKTKTAPIK